MYNLGLVDQNEGKQMIAVWLNKLECHYLALDAEIL